MFWSNPSAPNLNDYCAFVQFGMGIDPLYLPNVPPPPTAALAASPTGGSLATGTVYFTLTYVSALGETQAGPEASVSVTGPTGSVVVTSPAAATGAAGYNVYAATVTGKETLQNGSPVAIGTPFTLTVLIAGVAPPTVNGAGSPWLGYAFNQAMGLVLNLPTNQGIDYTLAVYNCAGHIQIRITPDQVVDNISRQFFVGQRKEYGLLNLSTGLIQATSNGDTSSTFAVSDSMSQLTLTDLDFVRTPWGRAYTAFAQDFGPTVWGLS